MDIAVVAVDGVFDSGLASVLDILETANALRDRLPGASTPFTLTTVGPRRRIRTGLGHLVETVPWDSLDEPPEVMILPALGVKTPDQVVEAVRDKVTVRSLAMIREAESAGVGLAGACTGTFFLAEAGVLDDRAATTSWWLGPAFRQRYPAVRLDETSSLTRDGGITTAGAAFAHIDLALSIVQRHNPALADLVGRFLLVGDRASQATFAIPAVLASADPMMSAFDSWVRSNLAGPLSLAVAAERLNTSVRTLQRTCTAVVGMSPIDFIQEVRMDEAVHLLRTTALSLEAISARVGYQNPSTLRSLVRRRRGTTVGALRRRPANVD